MIVHHPPRPSPVMMMMLMAVVRVVELVVLLAVPLVRTRPTHLEEREKSFPLINLITFVLGSERSSLSPTVRATGV